MTVEVTKKFPGTLKEDDFLSLCEKGSQVYEECQKQYGAIEAAYLAADLDAIVRLYDSCFRERAKLTKSMWSLIGLYHTGEKGLLTKPQFGPSEDVIGAMQCVSMAAMELAKRVADLVLIERPADKARKQ